MIPVCIGFGPDMRLAVHGIDNQGSEIAHEHIGYRWSPRSSDDFSKGAKGVLPAVSTSETEANLQDSLDSHVTLPVQNHFRNFPLYLSPFGILRDIYIFYRSTPQDPTHSRLLLQALKLLVVVHIGSNITGPSPSSDVGLEALVRATMKDCGFTPTPCFIRAQIGPAIGILGVRLMEEVLSS